ncbi:MAG TPA: acyltransferase [Solirubrobacteraceae bacterium]|nr:acyltransferase [Solirubrobacteraceae bacterium]
MVEDLRRRAWQAHNRWRVGASRLGSFGEGSGFQRPVTLIGPERIHIGRGTFFHSGAWLSVVTEHAGRTYDPRLTIGDRCVFARDVWISCVGEISLGDEVMVGDRVLITDTYHEYEDPDTSIVRQPMAPPRPVRIGDGVLLNTGCVITAGVSIGARSFVAANAVVTKDVPANTVVVGNPARAIRSYDREAGEWRDIPNEALGGSTPFRTEGR